MRHSRLAPWAPPPPFLIRPSRSAGGGPAPPASPTLKTLGTSAQPAEHRRENNKPPTSTPTPLFFFRGFPRLSPASPRAPCGTARPFHEVVGEVCRKQVRVTRGGGRARCVDFDARAHRGEHCERGFDRVDRIEDRLLVLLHVAIVGHGQTFQRRQKRDEIADDAPGLAARQLRDVGIFSSAA